MRLEVNEALVLFAIGCMVGCVSIVLMAQALLDMNVLLVVAAAIMSVVMALMAGYGANVVLRAVREVCTVRAQRDRAVRALCRLIFEELPAVASREAIEEMVDDEVLTAAREIQWSGEGK